MKVLSDLLKVLTIFGCTLLCLGCSEVAPWERGNLARPEMALDPNPNLNHIRDHIFSSREASNGGRANSGGGCGCN